MKDFKIQIEGMSCQHCVLRIKKAIGSLKGTQDIDVNLKEKFASGHYDESSTTLEQIKEVVKKTGYKVK